MKDLAVRLSREQIREGLRRSRKWQADWEKRGQLFLRQSKQPQMTPGDLVASHFLEGHAAGRAAR